MDPNVIDLIVLSGLAPAVGAGFVIAQVVERDNMKRFA
jgi:hypothetical protein